jgi:inosine-uridine nucleoside N-ribohydrolase
MLAAPLLALFLLHTPASEAAAMSTRLPVILSTDCGTEIDDQWMVIHLAISPEIEPLGFIGNHARNGLTGVKARDTIIDTLENRLGMTEHAPVLAGSDGPIAAPDQPNDNEGVRFLIAQSKRFSPTDRLNVLIIGSHTDVASAILSDPTIVQRIRVIMMGMVDWPSGNDEWNVKNDPEAARVVFGSGVPLVVGCSVVCIRDLSFTTEECQALVGGLGECGAWLARSFAEFGGRLDYEGRKVWPIWDCIAGAYLLGFAHVTEYHRPAIGPDLFFDHTEAQGQVTWVTRVDTGRFWADYTAKLKAWTAAKTGS